MFAIQTSHGPVPVWGRIGEGPLLFVIRGVLGGVNYVAELARYFPSVALVHLPGMYTPAFRENSIPVFADAFDQVVERLGGAAVVVGVSLGGVAALSMKRADRFVLLDPPLRTPLHDLTETLGNAVDETPALAQWFDDILGYRDGAWTERDYRPLVAPLEAPAHVLIGSRGYAVGGELAHPMVHTTVLDAGHELTRDAPVAVLDAIRQALAASAGHQCQVQGREHRLERGEDVAV